MSALLSITMTFLIVGFTAVISATMFGPGDVPRQIALIAMWFSAGVMVDSIWSQ